MSVSFFPLFSSFCFYDILSFYPAILQREVCWGSEEGEGLEAQTVSKLVEWERLENMISVVSELLLQFWN